MDNGSIGYYIRKRRLEMKMSQAALGHLVGKSSQVISNWERGRVKAVSVEELAKIADALNVDIRYFFLDNKKMPTNPGIVTDKRLQAIIDNYPSLDERTKDIIDVLIKVGKKKEL